MFLTMQFIQPKPYMEKLRTRNSEIGTVARTNATMRILEKGTPLPKPIDYEDIDLAMFNWTDKVLDLTYEGKRLPTYKLFSSQRISEYAQTWQNLDDSGSLILNFKTITRDTNPQKGEMYGGSYNIPGHRDFTMFYVPVLQANGTEAYDRYTMKQPFQVNFTYTISIVTNKLELLNKMNEMVMYEFNAITCYISPNEHPMPMTLEDITDESEYAIEDRKYYSQSYKIKVKGYIVRAEDYSVERIPARVYLTMNEKGIVEQRKNFTKKKKEDTKFERFNYDWRLDNAFVEKLNNDESFCQVPQLNDDKSKYDSNIEIEEDYVDTKCIPQENTERYMNVNVRVILTYDDCTSSLSFISEKDIVIDSVETENISDFKIFLNEEEISLESEVRILKDDKVEIQVTRTNLYKGGKLVLAGYDPNQVFDATKDAEFATDEETRTEEYEVNGDNGKGEGTSPSEG